jgi:RND superfamily putative drug exporter
MGCCAGRRDRDPRRGERAYSDKFRLSGPQSFDAVNLLQRSAPKASGDTEQIVIAVEHGRVTDPDVRARVESTLAGMARLPHVTEIASPHGARGAVQVSPSGKVAFASVTFDMRENELTPSAAKAFVNTARAGSGRGVQLEVEGQIAKAAAQQGPGGLPFGFLAAGIMLFLVFGSVLAMALPLLSAALALGTGLGIDGLLSHAIQMASFSSQLSLLIGLGVESTTPRSS